MPTMLRCEDAENRMRREVVGDAAVPAHSTFHLYTYVCILELLDGQQGGTSLETNFLLSFIFDAWL